MTENDQPRILSETEYLADDREVAAINAARFEEAKQAALASGKEPFDIDKFDEIYKGPNAKFERTLDREDRIKRWEMEYYAALGYKAATIAEFAKLRKYNDDNWV